MPVEAAVTGNEERIHRALASPVRSRLVALLRASRDGLDIDGLAADLDLHPNTVRSHLQVLAAAGLVDSVPASDGRPGRPRRIHRLRPGADRAVDGHEGYRFLAEVLAGQLATDLPDAARSAEDAGRAWGRRLVDGPVPGERLDHTEVLARLHGLLSDLGFEPRLALDRDADHVRVELGRCPFRDVARHHPDVACAVHRGVTIGALEELGSGVGLARLDATPGGTSCTAWLERFR